MKYRSVFVFLVLTLALAACAPAASAVPTTAPEATDVPTESAPTEAPTAEVEPTPAAPEVSGKLVIYSGRSEPLLQPVLDAFKAQYPNVEVLLKAGSNSEVANALLEEQANPQADVFITTELFTVQSLAAQGLFQAYQPAGAAQLPTDLLGPENTWVGLTRRARVIMYNTDLVAPEELPTSIFDLTDPKWKGQIAVAGSTNGSMQAQIAALRQLVGEEETEAWLTGLQANEVTFFGGHTDVRKAVGAGEFKLGLVNHYYYHLQLAEGSKVGVIYPDQGADQIGLLTNATAAAIVQDGPNQVAAQAFLDFLLSVEGQQIFARENYEYPAIPGVALREGVQPLDGFRLANVDIAKAAAEFEATFDLIEKIGLP